MKRLGAVLTTACVLFALSGCDGGATPPGANGAGPPKPPEELEKLFKKPEKGAGKKGADAKKAAPSPAPEEPKS